MTAADRDREAFEACQYAERLAASMHAKHYSDNTTWRPLSGDLIGLLTQIDNMAAGLTHARAQAGEPVAAGAWTREDLAAGLAELDGIDLVPPLKSVVDLEYLNRADDLLTFLSVASAANEPLGAIHPAPAQEPVAVPAVDPHRACRAAEQANHRFGQWMPQRWLDLFIQAYNEGGAK